MSFSLILYNEGRKRLQILWDYKSNLLTQIFMMVLIFVGATFLIGGGQFSVAQITSMLLGYTVWYFARIVIMTTSSDMLGEAQIGTLEQIYMSPAHPALILLARMFVLLVISGFIVVLPTLVIALPLGIHFAWHWESLIIFAVTLAGLFGFALALAGAALVFKQIDSLADLIQNVLLFLTGSLLPITHFPGWLFVFAESLPITQGIAILRSVEFQNESLVTAWSNHSLPFLLINSALYLGAGFLVYTYCERQARMKGSLGQY